MKSCAARTACVRRGLAGLARRGAGAISQAVCRDAGRRGEATHQLRNIAVAELVVLLLEGGTDLGALLRDHGTLLRRGLAGAHVADQVPAVNKRKHLVSIEAIASRLQRRAAGGSSAGAAGKAGAGGALLWGRRWRYVPLPANEDAASASTSSRAELAKARASPTNRPPLPLCPSSLIELDHRGPCSRPVLAKRRRRRGNVKGGGDGI